MRSIWVTAIAGALTIAIPVVADAQGGFTRRGAGADEGLGGRASFPEETGRKYDAMGDLKLVLEKITLAREQRDTLDRIEKTYRGVWLVTGRTVRDMFSRGRPTADDLDKLRDDTDSQRNAEYAVVRKVLTEAQLPAFEQNVEKVRLDESRREADMRARMPRGGRP